MLSSLCRAISSFSLRQRRHRLELWLDDLWITKIFWDMLKVFFTDIIFQYSFYISLVFDVVECFVTVSIFELEYCFTNAIINFYFQFSSFGVMLALYGTLSVRYFSLSWYWCFLTQLHVLAILSFRGLNLSLSCVLILFFMLDCRLL